METFKASNGRQIEKDHCGLLRVWEGDKRTKEQNMLKGYSYLNEYDIDALREFFLHERDQELGRWRCPEIPDWVVHADKGGERAWVVNERQIMKRGCIWRSDLEVALETPAVVAAARAFFEAHPVPKPWHDAKPGEVWVLEMDGEERAFMLDSADHFDHYGSYYEKDDPRITEGRRIWPEVPSE